MLHDVLVRTKKSSMHKDLTSMLSWPATAVVVYLNFFPSDVLSPVQMLKQAWMLSTIYSKQQRSETKG